MAKYTSEMVAVVFQAIVARYGGQNVPNQVMQQFLCQTFPEIFRTRSDAFLELIAKVDFASGYTGKGENIELRGYNLLAGSKTDGKRFWHPPVHWDGSMPLKTDASRIVAPLPTKQRKTIRFGEYVAAKKGDTTVE